MAKRVFLIVLDSFGIGGAPDAAKFGDEGSNTLAAVLSYSNDAFPNLAKMGLFAIDGEDDPRIKAYKDAQTFIPSPIGSYARVREVSAGKDSTIGHWEIAGIISDKAQPTIFREGRCAREMGSRSSCRSDRRFHIRQLFQEHADIVRRLLQIR